MGFENAHMLAITLTLKFEIKENENERKVGHCMMLVGLKTYTSLERWLKWKGNMSWVIWYRWWLFAVMRWAVDDYELQWSEYISWCITEGMHGLKRCWLSTKTIHWKKGWLVENMKVWTWGTTAWQQE